MDFMKRVAKAGVKAGVALGKSISKYYYELEESDDSYKKGYAFELYAVSLFHEDKFLCQHHTPKSDDLNGRRIESKLYPDFKFKHLRSGHEFWVECKWRDDCQDDSKLPWSYTEQLQRYREFQAEEGFRKVWVVIGLGGEPSMPERMFRMRLDVIQSVAPQINWFKKYERNPKEQFDCRSGQLI